MFGQLLKDARKSNKMSQDDLAEAIGVNRVAISNYEQGKNTPTMANLNKIRSILKLPSDYFDEKKDRINPTYRPLIGEASCGVPSTYYYDGECEMYSAPDGTSERSYYVRADGDSMEPDIMNGALVLCDPDAEVVSGKIVHYTWDGENGIKKYLNINGQVMLQPINTKYPPILITDAYELRMVKVAFSIKQH